MTAAFLGLEAALYAVFLTMDLTGGSGDPVKYALTLEKAAQAVGVNFIGGYSCLRYYLTAKRKQDFFKLLRIKKHSLFVA